LTHLGGCCIGEFRPTITGGVVPQPRQAIDVLVTFGIYDISSFATDPDFGGFMCGLVVKWVN